MSKAELARALTAAGYKIHPEGVRLWELPEGHPKKTKPTRDAVKALAVVFKPRTEAYFEGYGSKPIGAEAHGMSYTEEEDNLILAYRDCPEDIQDIVQNLLQVGQILGQQHVRKGRKSK